MIGLNYEEGEGASGPAGMVPSAETHRVRLAGRDLALSGVRGDPERYARLFAQARAELGHAQCLCRKPPLRLVIRCSRAGRFHVAGWPGEGYLHARECEFRKADPSMSGRGEYTDAILEGEITSIRLAVALTTLAGTRFSQPASIAPQSSGNQRQSMGLLGLLHYFWDESQLATWCRGTRRDWRGCHEALVRETQRCVINGQIGPTALYVVPPFERDLADQKALAFEQFIQHLGASRASRERRSALVLGEIKEVGPGRYGTQISLRHLRRRLFATQALTDRVQRSYTQAFATINAQAGRRIGIFLVDLSAGGHLNVIDMAVMLTSLNYIPADSSYEIVMADALVAADRTFVKPLRYDGVSAVFPDFVIIDGQQPVYVEVYGVQGREKYEQRKHVKRDYYGSQGGRCIEWSVKEPLPDVSYVATSAVGGPEPGPLPRSSYP